MAGTAAKDSPAAIYEAIERNNTTLNAHELDAIVALNLPDMKFENHPAGSSAQVEEVRELIARIFESWPDIRFEGRRSYYRDGLVVQEWTASATHSKTVRRGDIVAEPSGRRIEW